LLLVLAGCGSASGSPENPRLTVSAAASLKRAFTEYAGGLSAANARFSFAGSDALAAQIRQGVKPDLYAAANTELPRRLFEEGRAAKPVVFAGNRLVVAVPRGSQINSLAGLGRNGVKLAIGSKGVPVGAYTREVLGRLPAPSRRAILANVRSNEPDVTGVVGKLTRGAADAGFLYVTDVVATGEALRAVELPRRLRPSVRYSVAVVKGARQRRAARLFIVGLRTDAGRRALRRAGFELPPRPPGRDPEPAPATP